MNRRSQRTDSARLRRTPATLIAIALALGLASSTSTPARASASWTRSQFWILGGNLIEYPDTTFLTRVNDAGVDIITNNERCQSNEDARLSEAIALLDKLDYLTQKGLAAARTPLHAPVAHRPAGTRNSNRPMAPADAIEPFTLKANVIKGLGAGAWTNNWQADCQSAAIQSELTNSPLITPMTISLYIKDEPPVVDWSCPGQCGGDSSCIHQAGVTAHLVEGNSRTEDKLPYVNLLPISALCPGGVCPPAYAENYAAYLDRYLSLYSNENEPPPILSVDHYPFQSGDPNDIERNTYFQGLKVIRDKAAQYSRPGEHVPIWMLIQLSQLTQPTGRPRPTMAQVRWQAYCSVAYGAKGIGYFGLAPYTIYNRSPQCDAIVGEYGPGIVDANGQIVSDRYADVQALNRELHALGPTLVQLDPIATYHMAALGQMGLESDLFGSSSRVYNIVSSMSGSNNAGMVGYFKHQTTGEDYLMVVNKDDVNSSTYTVNLTNTADVVYRVSKVDGSLFPVATAANTFTVSNIPPGGGELFKVVDKVFEYIPNVNQIVEANGRTYYQHDWGIEMVNYATGHRTHVNGTGGHKHFAVTTTHTYFAGCTIGDPNEEEGGNFTTFTDQSLIYQAGLDLENPVFFNVPALTCVPINSIAAWDDNLIVGTGESNGRMLIIDSQGEQIGSKTWSTPIRQAMHNTVGSTILVAHGTGISRVNDTAPFATLNTWSDSPVRPVVAFAQGSEDLTYCYVALDNGSSGKVARLTSTLGFSNAWTDGVYPRCLDVSFDSGTDNLLVASVSGSTQKFTRFTAALGVLASQSATAPRACLQVGDTLSYLATASGVIKTHGSTLSQQYRSGPAADPGPVELSIVAPNPVLRDSRIQLRLSTDVDLRAGVYDLMGREVQRLHDGFWPRGTHPLQWDSSSFARGVYFLRVTVGARTLTRKLAVVG